MHYYAYGSLLNRDLLRVLCPTARPLGTASIAHHTLCFTGRSETWGGGTATIRLAPAQRLWGALYEIDAAGREQIERSGAVDGYVWAFTPVEDASGALVRAGLLVKVRDLQPAEPSPEYLEVLKAGWAQWGLDTETLLRQALERR